MRCHFSSLVLFPSPGRGYNFHSNPSLLQCYDCNSEYDPRCGDPFNPYSIGVVNCTEQKIPEHLIDHENANKTIVKPTVCRKLVQKVEGRKRVVRECGYLPDKYDDKFCVRRTGTAHVEVYYCACTTSLCNKASSLGHSWVFWFVFGSSATIFFVDRHL
ncbi:hypothetical protein ABEB36_001977 [Hypothenemus hampei]|uniref:Protein sleepless n=1 Tax=Hypothenemus hampei TaxID=57062 RepID=A0ABD1FGB1_HYPHA